MRSITVKLTAPDMAMAKPDREGLRHPLEKRVAMLVAGLDAILVAVVVALLVWGAEWIAERPTLAKYKGHGRILVVAVLGAPIVAVFAQRRRRMLALEESIRISATQLPEIHDVLVRHSRRLGVPLPELI